MDEAVSDVDEERQDSVDPLQLLNRVSLRVGILYKREQHGQLPQQQCLKSIYVLR